MYRRFFLLTGLYVVMLFFAANTIASPYDEYRQKSDYNEALEVPWVEIETQVDKLPNDNDLVSVELRNLPPNMTLFVDIDNATLLEDRVTRVWLVARSDSGSYNGSYEALRCETGEYKVYAYGNPKRKKPVRTVNLPRWRAVKFGGYRNELMFDHICEGVTQRPLDVVKESFKADLTADNPLY